MKIISSNVGNNQRSNLEDVISIKKALKSIGLYNGDTEVPYIDFDMDKGIRNFQKNNNLKIDGLIKPGGETEDLLIKISGKSPIIRCPICGAAHGGSKGSICPDCTIKL